MWTLHMQCHISIFVFKKNLSCWTIGGKQKWNNQISLQWSRCMELASIFWISSKKIDWKFFLLLINCVIIGNIRIWWRSNFYWEEIEKIYHWNFGMQFSWWRSFCSRCLQKKSWCYDLFSSVWCHLHWYQPAWICNE